MMIRSQDRMALYPINCGLYIRGNEKDHFKIMIDMGLSANGNGDFPIGEYSSGNRCLEILDEIQKMASQYVTTQNGLGVINFAFEYPKVYEMPEK